MKIKVKEAHKLGEALNNLVSGWGLQLPGPARVRAIRLLGKLNDELVEFEKERARLFEIYGEDLPLPPNAPEGTPPPKGRQVPERNKEAFMKEFLPLLEEETDIDEETVHGRFTEAELGNLDPQGDQMRYLALESLLKALAPMIKD
jgi:hypothetical protein